MSEVSISNRSTGAGPRRTSSFDVVCAGEAQWDFTAPRGASASQAASMRFRAGGAAVNAALALAQRGLHVGLAAAIADDALGRELCAKVAAAGVDIGGVALAPTCAGLVLSPSDGSAQEGVVHPAGAARPVAVPRAWEAQVLLLSGLSPALAHAAGLCKAARSARRAGAIVVVDVNARWRLWTGRDARATRTVLHEADVVRCSTADLAVLKIDAATVRSSMRLGAVLVLTDGAGIARATGPFGEITRAPQVMLTTNPAGAGDAFTAALCAELARVDDYHADSVELWTRVLQRGHTAAHARLVVQQQRRQLQG
ncbi:MAG: PfkB family carbohydrate kinase [Byssovorax sp.]